MLIFAIFVLVSAFAIIYKKTNRYEKKIGEEAAKAIEEYQEGEKALFYIDQSAKYATYKALYSFAKKGMYFKDTPCTHHKGYTLWEEVAEDKAKKKEYEISCYPSEIDIRENLARFLNAELNKYLEAYTITKLPKDNYDFIFKKIEGKTEIVGIATRDITIKDNNNLTEYRIKPSFKTEIEYDIIGNCTHIKETIRKISNNIKDCLRRGSDTPEDIDDLITCSDIKTLKTNIMEIKDWNISITPLSSKKEYLLLFNITMPLENPYYQKNLTFLSGIRFLDSFPPPQTEAKIKTNKSGNYLIWEENPASDVESYYIYAIEEKEALKLKKPTLIETVKRKSEGPYNWTTAEETFDEDYLTYVILKELEWKKEIRKGYEWKIPETINKGYLLYIIAKDNIGNSLNTEDIEPLRLL